MVVINRKRDEYSQRNRCTKKVANKTIKPLAKKAAKSKNVQKAVKAGLKNPTVRNAAFKVAKQPIVQKIAKEELKDQAKDFIENVVDKVVAPFESKDKKEKDTYSAIERDLDSTQSSESSESDDGYMDPLML